MQTILPDFDQSNFQKGDPIDNPYFPVELGTVLFETGGGWDNSIARLYEIYAIPSIWVIDADGRAVLVGARGEQLEEMLGRLLGADTG